MTAPITFQWSGEAMVPLARFHNVCNAEFVVGELYRLVPHEERSQRSHNHYFACIHEAWLNVPDALAMQFATDEHLRKHALIMSGYRDERKFVASSAVEARKIAAFIKPRDDYAIVSVAENVVIEWTAKSQSRKAMGQTQFQKSKDDVLEYVAEMIGVKAADLARVAA